MDIQEAIEIVNKFIKANDQKPKIEFIEALKEITVKLQEYIDLEAIEANIIANKSKRKQKEFKVGDSVRVIDNNRNVLDLGEIVRIVNIDNSEDMNIDVVNDQRIQQAVGKHEIEHI